MKQQPDTVAGGTVQSARNLHFCSRNADAGDRVVCQHRQAFAAAVIDHAQDPEPPAIDQGIRHKAERPALVRTLKRVAELEPKNIKAQLSYLAAPTDLGLLNNPSRDQLKPVIDRMFAIGEFEPKALWVSGLIAKSEGGNPDALREWSKLLSTYTPTSVEYRDLKNKISELRN